MNVEEFTTNIFKNELEKYGIVLNPQSIRTLQDIFDFNAIEFQINQDLQSRTRIGKIMENMILTKHKNRLTILTKRYAYIVSQNNSKSRIINESVARKSQAELKCNSDIYPCEKKGFSSAY